MSKTKFVVTSKVSYYQLRLYINGLLHISVPTEHLKVRSWVDTTDSYSIELAGKGESIITTYNSFDKWKAILTELDNIL